jgi:DNA polymerase elongation subunit (family B)
LKQREPRIAYIDIETAPIIMASWTLWEANAVWVVRDTYLNCFSVQWEGSKRVETYALPDYPSYRNNHHCDKSLCKDLWRVLDEAQIVVAHNGDAFDIKKINSRLSVNGFKAPSPYKTIDTLKISRKHFKFDSNKLDNLGRYHSLGRKLQNGGATLWERCYQGDLKAWDTMRRYNKQDVRLLRDYYLHVRGWASSHPDLRAFSGATGCPTCQSSNIQRRGTAVARTRKYQRFQCSDCGSWFNDQAKKAG